MQTGSASVFKQFMHYVRKCSTPTLLSPTLSEERCRTFPCSHIRDILSRNLAALAGLKSV